MKHQIFADPEAVAAAAADELIELASDAIAERGVFHIALSGGSTPKRLFDVLVTRGRDALPWDSIDLWWSDERTVPPEHPDSNYGMARQHLLEPLGLTRVHRLAGEQDPAVAAASYEQALLSALGAPPVFDLVLLGMGKDGHTMSLFPGSPALTDPDRFVVANPVDSPLAGGRTTRLTLTPAAIMAARHTRFLITGSDKADALAGVLHGPPGRFPAQLVTGVDIRCFVDQAAAMRLEVT